jgi:hypothetical protein
VVAEQAVLEIVQISPSTQAKISQILFVLPAPMVAFVCPTRGSTEIRLRYGSCVAQRIKRS